MAVIAAVIFDLGDTLVKTPWGITLMERGSAKEIAKFKSTVRVTFDSLVKSGIEIDWPSFYDKYMYIRAEQLAGVAEMIGPPDSTADAMLSMSKVFIDVGMLDEGVLSFRNGSKYSYELITTNCVNGDGCKAMIADGIIQSGTKKPICASALGSSVAAELVTKVPHEYEIITLSPPNCVAKVMRLE